MPLSAEEKRKIEEEEKYRRAVVASVTQGQNTPKHGAPLLLSFFIPGLGQLVKGQVKKGLLIFFGPIIAFFIFLILGFMGGKGSGILALFGQLWIGWIVLYIWQLIDAYNN